MCSSTVALCLTGSIMISTESEPHQGCDAVSMDLHDLSPVHIHISWLWSDTHHPHSPALVIQTGRAQQAKLGDARNLPLALSYQLESIISGFWFKSCPLYVLDVFRRWQFEKFAICFCKTKRFRRKCRMSEKLFHISTKTGYHTGNNIYFYNK